MVQDPPYSDKIYNALKSKVDGFNLSPEEFNERINDAEYQKKVYGALKSKVDGFKLSENDFYERIKKKESTGEFSTPSPLLPQEPVQNWSKDYLTSLQYQPSPLEPVQETQPLAEPVVTGTIPITPDDNSEERANKFLADEQQKDLEQLRIDTDSGNIGIKNPFVKELMNAPAPITVNPEKSAKEAITRFQEDITGKPEHQGVVNEVLSDLAQVPPSFNKGVISVASTIPKGVAILAKKLDDMTGDRSEDIEKYSTYQLGQWIEDKAKEIGIGVVDDKRAGFINSTVPMAFGQMIGMMLTGGPAAAEAGLVPESIARQTVNTLTSPMAMSGALQAAVPEYEAAKAAGQSDSEAFSVFFKNIPGGMTEVIPIANMFSRLNKVTGNGLLNALKLGTAQGFEEGSQEAVQQYLTNKIAQGTYDPKRDLREGLLEGAGAGFIVGFLMPGIMGAMENMTPEDKLDTKNIIEEYLNSQPEQTVKAPSGDLGVKPATNEKPKEQVEPVKPAEVPKVKAKESVPVQSEPEVKGEKVKPVVKPEDLARFQQLSESVREGEMLLKDNIDPSGKKLTPEKRDQIVSSVESAKQKIQSLTNKGQEKISKGLESIATKIKPKVKEGVKTIKQLETENKKTFPKVPVKNVFSNDTEQPPREQRLKADKHIDDGTIATLPKQEIDVKDIVPTQKNLTIGNLENTKDVKDSKEDIILLKHEGKFYVLDGHHRIANDILQGKKTIEANVYEDTKKTDKGSEVSDIKSEEVVKPEEGKKLEGLLKSAVDAHRWSSFSPDKRGRQMIDDYEGILQSDIDDFKKAGVSQERIDEYVEKFKSKLSAYIGARSRVANPMVTGPSNFPTARNQKALRSEDNKYKEFKEWRDKAHKGNIRGTEAPITPDTELDKAKADLASREKNQELMVDANKIIRSKKDVAQRLKELGFTEREVQELEKPDYAGRVGFASFNLTNNNASIKRLRDRVKELESKVEKRESGEKEQYEFEGGTVDVNRQIDRVQIIHKEKPDAATIAKLKSNGWNWSPKEGAWQRKITNAAIYDAQKLTGAKKVEQAKAKELPDDIDNDPQVEKIRSFKTENGQFSVYDTDKEHTGRGDMFTVKEDKDGWIVQNALVPDKLQKQGIATEFYQKMNEASMKATGKPLRSTQPRKLLTGETVHELSEGGIKLWDSLVKKGVAEKLGEKDYRFVDKNKVEANEKAKLKGFDSASHALNSVKKRTGKEYKTVQEIPDKVLEEVSNERGYDKLEAKAKELTESIEQDVPGAEVAYSTLETGLPKTKSTQKSVETVVENKAEELQEAATDLFKAYPQDKKLQNQRLKNQKTDLLEQMAEVEEVLWGTIPKEKREAIKELDKKGTIATPFEESALAEVKKLGYKVTDKGQILFEVKDDGTFKIHYASLLDAIERVKKEFPEKIERVDFKLPREGGKTPDWVKARDRGSLARNKVFLENAKENLAEAKKAGNKKLAEAYQKELEREQKIYSEAENIDWEAEAASKEMDTNDEVLAWREEYENGGQKNYYNQLGFYGFTVQDFMEAKKRGLLDKGYSFEEIKTLLESDKPIQEYRKELETEAKEAEAKLDAKFARKDGKGYKQPTTNNDKAEFSRLQKTINNSENKIRVIDNILGEAAPIPDKFKKFVKAVENSGSLGEARVNLQNIKGVSAELAQEFRDTFARKRDSIDQAVEQFYNRVKSGQKLSKKEEGKAKVAKGIEGIVNKMGGMAMLNPLDDTSVWEDVKNIIDGLADIGTAKSEEVIEFLKKEFAKIGIKESDVEEKRGEIVEYVEGKNPKEPEPPKEQETKKESGRKKSLLNRAFEGTDDTELSQAIEKHGLTYEPETWLHAKERAKSFVEEVGFDNALDAVRRNKIEGGSAAFVWSELIDSVGSELAEVTDEEQKQRLMKLESDLIDEFDRKAREGGRFISALQEVYASSDFGYKLDFQIEEYKKRNNGVIEPEVEERFKELDKQLTEAKAKRVEAEERAKKAEDELALQNIKESIARGKKQNTRSAQKIREAKNERAKLKSEFLSLFNPSKSGGKVTASVIPGATLAIYGVKIANTYIKEGVARIEEIVAKTKEFFDKELGYKLSPDELNLIQKKIEESVAETEEKEGIVRVPHKMIRAYVESGIDTIEGLVAKIKESIKDRHPNVTDREIRDVITGYGKTINPSKDEVEVKIRKMLRIGKIISGLEDVANKKRPLRSGRQRDKLDAQERALNKELKSAMRDLPQDAETEAEQLKTSLDAVKTRLKNQIEELNLAIETGKKSAKAKGVEYDAEAKELAEQRDQVKEIYDAIFYKREDDTTKIENVLKSIEKTIEDTIKKIETNDLEAKKQKKIDSPDIRAARERLNRAKDRLIQLQEEAGIPSKRRLEATKQRLKNQIEDLKERLATGNFDRKKRPDPVTRDSELLKIDAEIAGLKEKFAKEQYKAELKNRTIAQKLIDAAIEIWGLSRVLRATGEFSFVLIQNGIYTISHPITALRAIKTAFGHFFSEKKHENFMNHIRAQDYYSRARASKLAISETDVKLTAREEMFIGSWGNKLWDLLGYPLYPWKSAYDGWKSVNPLKAFERAGTGFLNTIRTTRYIEAEEMLRLQGRNFQEHPEDYKNAADVINTFTGRASLGWADRIAKPLAIVFFSPRNWASIIKQATPYAFYHFGKMSQKDGKVSVAQKMAMSDYLVAIGTTTAIVMLVDAMGGDGDDDEITVEKDPRSSDFMKIKIGNTRIDPWGGRQSMIVLQARLLMNSIKKESGQVQTLGQGQTSTGVELIGRIAKNKLSPSSSLAFKFLGKKTKIINGVEVWVDDYGNELYPDPAANLYPIYAETIAELYREQPQMLAHLITFMSFWGLGTQTYNPQDMKRKKYEYYQRVYDEIEAEKGN